MQWSESRVLVTGGAGFIGSEVVRQLSNARARRVHVVDNLVNGSRANLEGMLDDACRLHEVDIRDTAAMQAILDEGIDVVLHLACLGVRHSLHSPIENASVNATATLDLLRLAHEREVGRFVYVSSSEVYGTATTVPMSESHPTLPMTVYGASKLAGEAYTRAYFESYGAPNVVVRPFNSFGPRCHHEGDSGEVIPKFVLRALAGRPLIVFGDGSQTRDFTYVEDTARGILLAATEEAAIGRTINLGSGHEIAIRELADLVLEVLDADDVPIEHAASRPGDVLRLFADPGTAAELLGFQPEVELRSGLLELKRWYESHGRPPEELLEDEVVINWATAE